VAASSHAAEFPQEPGVAAAHEGLGIDAEPVQACQVLLQLAGEPPQIGSLDNFG
jgi:hypothetical protein